MAVDNMPTPLVEVAFSAGASTGTLLTLDDPSRGKIGTGTLGTDSSPDPVWTDITNWVMSASLQRGSTRVDSPILTYEAGTCAIKLLNSDRRFDPSNLDGPYVDSLNGTTQVTPMRAIRIRALWNSVYYELFRGFVDEWEVAWSDPNYSECTVTATDAFKVFGNVDRPEVSLVGAGDDTGARIDRILDSINWPDGDRMVAVGDSTLQATTLGGTALSELQLAADSELGELYIDGGGRVVFRNRNALFEDTRSNLAQATFGDGGGAELPYQDLTISADDATFYNKVRVAVEGGTAQTASDSTSITLYYEKTYVRTDLILQTDADAVQLASWLLYVSKDPELRFVELVVNPRSNAATLFPHCLGREIGDRIQILRRPPGGGDPIDRDVFIRGIQHEFDPANWLTTWTLQSAERYGSFLTLDHADLGRLNSNALAY